MSTSQLKKQCKEIRQDILTMIHKAKSGHPGGSLSAVELMTTLYFSGIFREHTQNNPDRFILSKGHVAPLVYSIFARKGYFELSHLATLRKMGSILQGHPHASKIPGLCVSSGSLGQGLSVAVGIALAQKRKNQGAHTYCLLGDGELQEGQVWEGLMSAAHHKLDNLCIIVDSNGIQLDGAVKDIKNIDPLKEKFEAFNIHVIPVDGHDVDAILPAYQEFLKFKGKPTLILASTVKGKGVSFMENQAAWHGNAPNAEQLAAALAEIEKGE